MRERFDVYFFEKIAYFVFHILGRTPAVYTE